jgi:hypothetical protein
MPYSASIAPIPSQLIDINGDGLDDWVYSDDNNTYVLLNRGAGWSSSPDSQWTIATSTHYLQPGSSPATYYDRGIRFMDMNGDGLPDFVRSYDVAHGSPCVTDGYEVANVHVVYLNTGSGWATSTAYTLPDNAFCNERGSLNNKEYGNWTGNGQMNQDVLSEVTSPKGGSTSVTYTPSTQLGTNPQLPVSLLVVTQTVANDGLGNTITTTYSY